MTERKNQPLVIYAQGKEHVIGKMDVTGDNAKVVIEVTIDEAYQELFNPDGLVFTYYPSPGFPLLPKEGT
jgi:hypothetical protein